MANIKSQKKRILTNEQSRIANKQLKSKIKTFTKKYKSELINNSEKANEIKNQTISFIDSAFTKGVFHKNKVNRLKSKLMKLSNK